MFQKLPYPVALAQKSRGVRDAHQEIHKQNREFIPKYM